jgi:hypothetical protein
MKIISTQVILIVLLYGCASFEPVNDFFGIQMNPLEEASFRIISYDDNEGVKYTSSPNMDFNISAWAEIGVEDITFKISNKSGRDIPLSYFNDDFIVITDEKEYHLDKGNRRDYFFGDKISPGSEVEITLKLPSDFEQDFAKRGDAKLDKDIMGDFSKNWSLRSIVKENIKYIVIKLSDVAILLKYVQ